MAEQNGHSVTILARNEDKAKRTTEEIMRSSGNTNINYMICDLSRKKEIIEVANNWSGSLHILINDAGVTPRKRLETPEGIEMQWATNVLGYFWMMKYFTPMLEKSQSSRIVNVASYWAGDMDMNDLEFKQRYYNNDTAYRQSKQANRMLTVAFAKRLKTKGITVNACHPGDVRSALASNLGYGGHESPDQGAATPVWLATSPELKGITGKYFEHLQESRCRFGEDFNKVEMLYEICERY
jgi:retinol dehydrogenase-13